MFIKKRALLLGDYENANWHPLKEVDKEISEILMDEISVFPTEDYGDLKLEDFMKYDMVILYVDQWEKKANKELISALLSFACQGGAILALHNGIILPNSYELSQMLGAKFTGHPEHRLLKYIVTAPEHIIMEGIEKFEMDEEPYQFAFDPFTEKVMLLEFTSEEKQWPGAWAQEYGKGKIVYLSPGHNAASFKNEMYRKLVLRSSKWSMGLI